MFAALFGGGAAPDEQNEREVAVARLAKRKTSLMVLTNHITAWNAIQKLEDPHREMLKRMGYSVLQGFQQECKALNPCGRMRM